LDLSGSEWRPVVDSLSDTEFSDFHKMQGMYSFVNITVTNWNQMPAEAVGTSPCQHKTFRKRVRKAIISGMK